MRTALLLIACFGCTHQPTQKEVDATYISAVAACASTAKTRAEADECYAKTRASFGLDGGSDAR